MQRSKVRKNKFYANVIEGITREKIWRGDLIRQDFNYENLHKFLSLLKIRKTMQVDEMKEINEEEFTIVGNKSKRRRTSSMFYKIYYSSSNVP